ncbi:MAG: hypothetical protein JWQ89_3332 [Devosia sp.]|nr:hypothetical protein [Devosia sp.]
MVIQLTLLAIGVVGFLVWWSLWSDRVSADRRSVIVTLWITYMIVVAYVLGPVPN